ncbi:MAG TPA: hypothetical protein VI409_09660 [Gaiellaceae bacterium]|nr:hypothetical protein [Gaiellaceae bacterium]
MNVRYTVLVAVAAAVALASVATAAPDAGRQQITIMSRLYPGGTFVFTPLVPGALKRDSGKVGVEDSGYDTSDFTFRGKRGTLTLREQTEWVDIWNEEVNGVTPGVSIGPWKVVRGTGQYAKVTGSGRSVQVGLGNIWYARHEGYLKVP